MHNFYEHIHFIRLAEQLHLLGENIYNLDFDAYDQLFATELKRLAMQVRHPATRAQLEDMADSRWLPVYRTVLDE